MARVFLMLVLVAGLLVLGAVPASATDANGNHDTDQFLAGLAPAMGPDVAASPSGATVTLTGSGSFKAGPDKTASGGGTYTIKDAAGNTVASGAWTVTGVLGFVDYGNGTPQGFPSFTHGGEGRFQVSLAGVGDGVLTITCVLGSPPPGKEEGITLVLGHGMNFTKPAGGETVFITP